MLTFKSNISNILLRCTALLIVALCIKPFVYIAMQDPRANDIIFGYVKKIYLIYFVAAILVYFALLVVLTLSGIIKVEVDTTVNTITFISLFKKKTISTNEIDSYFSTIHKNRFTAFTGILLNLKSGKCVLLTGQNIIDVAGLKGYLGSRNISYLGERKMKFPFN